VRLTPIRIGETKGLLLGPLTIEPPFRERGIGQTLIMHALAQRSRGHRLVVLVRDDPTTASADSSGFRTPRGDAGPVDPAGYWCASSPTERSTSFGPISRTGMPHETISSWWRYFGSSW